MNESNKKRTVFSEEDNKYMRLAIKLAGKGRGKTNPNPMVGAVIVKDGRIISQGYHKQVGLSHAEIEAINNSKESLENSTMYVTLEPCTLHGKTLPCVNEIVRHNFKKIIIGSVDPNPGVNGRGIEFLKRAGINVESGLLEDKVELQNEVFFKQIKAKIPFVCCKIASSIDGKLATRSSDSKWITSEKSRKQVQNLRKEYGCTLTGINTVLNDDPYLFPRKISGNASKTIYTTSSRKFYRIILDSDLKIALHPDINIIKTSGLAKTIIFTGNKKNPGFQKRVRELQKGSIDVLTVGKNPLGAGLEINKIKDSINLKFENVKRIGNDIVVTAYPLKQQKA